MKLPEADLLEVLKNVKKELQLSGNWEARDYGWPANRKAIDAAIAKLESGSASTAGPRCPKCGRGGENLVKMRLPMVECLACKARFETICVGDFAQFFAAAPVENTKPTRDAVKWFEDMGYGQNGRFDLAAKREWHGYEIQEILELFALGFPESGRTDPKPEDVQPDVEAARQQEIDISNLRFYSAMAHEFRWQTDIIHFGVIEQTLKEIADRLALLRRVSAPEVVFEFSPSPCGHSSQYAYTEDGGKNIVCLVCERRVSGKGAQRSLPATAAESGYVPGDFSLAKHLKVPKPSNGLIKLREYASLFDNDKPSAHRRFIELEAELLDCMGTLPAEGL